MALSKTERNDTGCASRAGNADYSRGFGRDDFSNVGARDAHSLGRFYSGDSYVAGALSIGALFRGIVALGTQGRTCQCNEHLF